MQKTDCRHLARMANLRCCNGQPLQASGVASG
jgi:hypothetical protein